MLLNIATQHIWERLLERLRLSWPMLVSTARRDSCRVALNKEARSDFSHHVDFFLFVFFCSVEHV